MGSEFDLIARIRRATEALNRSPGLLSGIGDDAAVLDHVAGRNTVITTDMLIEEIDFLLDAAPARLLGHKALAVSLSDIAAMGAKPRWSLLSLGIPSHIWKSRFIDWFYEGYFSLASRYGVTLVGGDISRSPDRVVIDSILIGESEDGRAILRSGAQPGDHIFVTGTVGGAAAGLDLIKSGHRLPRKGSRRRISKGIEHLLLRQLRPEPRVDWGVALGTAGLASAAIDLSDGLSSDLAHLCVESRAGALVEAARLPLDQRAVEHCRRHSLDPIHFALNGGEDFELVFTVRADDLARLPSAVAGTALTEVGVVTDEPGVVRLRRAGRETVVASSGFQHF